MMQIEPFEDKTVKNLLTVMRAMVTVGAGGLFGYGLGMSAMVYPSEVLGFLRFQNMGLLLVLGAAALVVMPFLLLAPQGLRAPLLGGGPFERHASVMGAKTVVGSAIFGMGWGLCGVCPGPAIASLGAGNWQVLWVLLGIFGGALLQGLLANWASSSSR